VADKKAHPFLFESSVGPVKINMYLKYKLFFMMQIMQKINKDIFLA